MKKLALITSLAAAAALAAGCGAVSNGGSTTPTPSNSGTPTPTPTGNPATTIAQINQGSVAPNTSVTLTGIVVTAVDAFGDFYAQDAGGGDYSGIYFFDKNHHAPANIAIGDELTVSGTFSPYQGPASSPWTTAENEIIPDSVSQTNTGLTPVAIQVPAANLATELGDATGVPTNTKYMGAFIQVTGSLQVTSVGMGFGEYAVGTSSTQKTRVDHGLFDSFEPRLVGENVTTLQGVVAWDFNHYHINPRSAADIVGDGSNPIPTSTRTIADILANATPGQLVKVTAYVTGDYTYQNSSATKTAHPFWAADATTAAVNAAIYIEDPLYKNNTVSTGNQVTFVGKYVVYGSTFKTHSILVGYSDMGTFTGSGSNTLTPLSVTLSQIHKGASNTAQYENVLVSLSDSNMTVQTTPDTYGEWKLGTDATTNFVTVGKMATTIAPAATGKAVTAAQGIVYFAHGNNYIEPRTAGDFTISP